jgi:hypothetical protein
MAVPPNINVRINQNANIGVKLNKSPTVAVNQSGLISRFLDDLIDVDTSAKTDGSLLVYDAVQEKFVATTLLEKQTINGGHF